ncbi:MAG: hypothetical protein IJG38_05000 [Thermoguttaceae bacterium]|nr:hypothetical protein [Thermoguttaceae bacterium]
MRYKSHFLSSRRFNYALRTTMGGGHSVYIVDYILNKDSLYSIDDIYDSSTGAFTISCIYDSNTPFNIEAKNDLPTSIYRVDYIRDSGSLYTVKDVGDYNK